MVTKTVPARSEVPAESKWNLEAVFPQDTQWEDEYNQLDPFIEQLKSYDGRLGESAATLLERFQLRDNINHQLERLYACARMRRDQDNSNPHYEALEGRTRMLVVRVEEASACYNPEL